MNCHGCYHGCYEPLCQICLVKGHQYYGVVWVVVTEDTCILTCSDGVRVVWAELLTDCGEGLKWCHKFNGRTLSAAIT